MTARMVRSLAWLAWLPVSLAAVWAVGALAFDFPWPPLRRPAAALLGATIAMLAWRQRSPWRRLAAVAAACLPVAAWWLTLRPSDDRPWQPDVARVSWAEINGDSVTLHNVRHCDYRTPTDYTTHWETRTVNLSRLTGVDLAVTYWGSPWMAHPIASFQFSDAPPICFSIETRKEVGESYSALGGLYRRFELIYVAADERDVLRLRTHIRPNQNLHLYRLTATPDQARASFLEYLHTLNHLQQNPHWYNAITTNCTTAIRSQRDASRRMPWDWRLLVNGKADELLYEKAALVTAGLPFAELKKRALVNPALLPVETTTTDYSQLIRQGRPGF